jgi:hypothetical protein
MLVFSTFYRVLLPIGKLEAGLLLGCTCQPIGGVCILTITHATAQVLEVVVSPPAASLPPRALRLLTLNTSKIKSSKGFKPKPICIKNAC